MNVYNIIHLHILPYNTQKRYHSKLILVR